MASDLYEDKKLIAQKRLEIEMHVRMSSETDVQLLCEGKELLKARHVPRPERRELRMLTQHFVTEIEQGRHLETLGDFKTWHVVPHRKCDGAYVHEWFYPEEAKPKKVRQQIKHEDMDSERHHVQFTYESPHGYRLTLEMVPLDEQSLKFQPTIIHSDSADRSDSDEMTTEEKEGEKFSWEVREEDHYGRKVSVAVMKGPLPKGRSIMETFALLTIGALSVQEHRKPGFMSDQSDGMLKRARSKSPPKTQVGVAGPSRS
ncbi:MAG: hypothetical protein Q9159_002149 [Coniocarpon cinnabarinum]